MAQHRQTVGAGQTRRTRTNHNNTFARHGRTLKRMHILGLQMVGGITLQLADHHRLALGHLTHTDLLAERFGRADPRTHAAKDVLAEDRLGRRIGGAGGDLANEQRNVDVGRTGRHARCVMAEVTAVRRDQSLMFVQGWMEIRKPLCVVLRL